MVDPTIIHRGIGCNSPELTWWLWNEDSGQSFHWKPRLKDDHWDTSLTCGYGDKWGPGHDPTIVRALCEECARRVGIAW